MKVGQRTEYVHGNHPVVANREDLVAIVRDRIESGTYAASTQVPSCRQLATELGVHKNAVNRAYQLLAQSGYLRSQAKRGYVVAPASSRVTPHAPELSTEDAIRLQIRRAMLAGRDREWILNTVTEEMNSYGRTKMVALIECNLEDATVLARQIEDVIQTRCEPFVLGDVIADPSRVTSGGMLVVTTFFHLQEVRHVLRGRGPGPLAIHAAPTFKTIQQIGALPRDATVCVVASMPGTLSSLVGLVESIHQGSVLSCLADDGDGLAAALSQADVVIDTKTCHDSVAGWGQLPAITVEFRLAPESLGPVTAELMAAADRMASNRR